jgi:phosphoserine phosphatase
MAVGDGANDIPMLNACGVGVAFNAKPIVKESAPFRIDCSDMQSLLFLLNTESDYFKCI